MIARGQERFLFRTHLMQNALSAALLARFLVSGRERQTCRAKAAATHSDLTERLAKMHTFAALWPTPIPQRLTDFPYPNADDRHPASGLKYRVAFNNWPACEEHSIVQDTYWCPFALRVRGDDHVF